MLHSSITVDFDLTFFGVRVPAGAALVVLIAAILLGAVLLLNTTQSGETLLASIGASVSSIFIPNATTTTSPDSNQQAATPPQGNSDSLSPNVPLTPGHETSTIYPLPGGSSYTAPEPNGRPDLISLIREVGVIDSNNNFIASNSVRANERGGVRFAIINIGTATARDWYFNAVLPTYPAFIFTSENQTTLRSGERIEFTLGFDNASTQSTNGVITINVNPAHIVQELNFDNNIIKATLTITP